MLTTGVVLALAAPAVFTVLSAAGSEGETIVGLMLWAVALPAIVGLQRMLGIRRKQGSSSLTTFAATRALGTARLVGMKVLITSLTVLVSWVAVVTSVKVVGVELAAWGPRARVLLADYLEFLSVPDTVADLTTLTIVVVQVTGAIALVGVLHALLVLNAKRVVLAGVSIALYATLIVVMAEQGWVDGAAIGKVQLGILTGGVILGTIYLLRRAYGERIFTASGAAAVLGIGVSFAVATGSGWIGADSLTERMAGLLIGLMPLAAAVLAPWTFGRLRHR